MQKKEEENKENNSYDDDGSIIIAGKRYEVYNQILLNKFQKFDQIQLCVLDQYVEKAIYIIRQWEALGVLPVNGHPIKFTKEEEDIVIKNTSKSFKRAINKITISKHPELYRFTKN